MVAGWGSGFFPGSGASNGQGGVSAQANPGGAGFGPNWGPQNPGGGVPYAPPPSDFQNARSALQTYYSPTLDQYNQGSYADLLKIGANNDMLGLNQQQLQLGYQGNLGDLNTQIDTNALQRARSQMDSAAYANMMGYNTDVFNSQAAGLANTSQKNLSDINSQATANGAYTASGTNANRTFNAADFFDQYGALAGNYKQQQEMLNMRKGNADTQAQILDRTAQNLGMKSDLLKSTLDNGLARLGLSNSMSTIDLLNGVQNGSLQALQLLNQITQTAGQYATGIGQR